MLNLEFCGTTSPPKPDEEEFFNDYTVIKSNEGICKAMMLSSDGVIIAKKQLTFPNLPMFHPSGHDGYGAKFAL